LSEILLNAARAAADGAWAASEGETAARAQSFRAAIDDAAPRRDLQGDGADGGQTEHSGGSGIAGVWDSAISGVTKAYDTVNGALHQAGRALDDAARQGIDAATGAVHDIAGNTAAGTFRDIADSMHQQVKDTVGLGYGIAEGATEAAGGMVKGVGDLAGDGYAFATDGTFRGKVVHSAQQIAEHVVQDPTGSVKSLGEGALHAGHAWLDGAAQAARQGDLGEYVGRGVGNLAVNIGGFAVPGADAADVANLASKAGEATEILGDTARGIAGAERAVGLGAGAARTARLEAAPVSGMLHGTAYEIPGWHLQQIDYVKRLPEARNELRQAFNQGVRKDFVKDLAANHADELRAADLSEADIQRLARGRIPEGYQVHHILPLDDGGTNAYDNLVLIRNNPDHMLITNHQNAATRGLEPGEARHLEWPVPDQPTPVWPERPGGGAVEAARDALGPEGVR
jgi:hypothetical protein